MLYPPSTEVERLHAGMINAARALRKDFWTAALPVIAILGLILWRIW